MMNIEILFIQNALFGSCKLIIFSHFICGAGA